jgi:hypothetical protein
MAQPRRVDIRDKDLHGLKYFRLVGPLLERLQSDAAARDKAGNRQLFFDQYAGLLLLTFFSPIVTSLRALQQASGLAKVQKLLGCQRAALGSLSEASRVFDPALLRQIIGDLARQGFCRWPKAAKPRPCAASPPSTARSWPPCPKWPGRYGAPTNAP